MRVLQVSAYDLMGEQFNGLALHRAMTALGIESSMLVHDRFGEDPGVATMAGPLLYRLNRITQPIEDLLSLHSVLDVAGFGLFRSPQYRTADVVHLQLRDRKGIGIGGIGIGIGIGIGVRRHFRSFS
jgi:hypothetical protein